MLVLFFNVNFYEGWTKILSYRGHSEKKYLIVLLGTPNIIAGAPNIL